MKLRILAGAVLFGLTIGAGYATAADKTVGKVVAVRGQVTLARGRASVPARVRSEILAHDTVKTGAAARAKLLFIDESVLTLGEKSQLVVQNFVKEKGKTGNSVFNLIDGKMRSVVGKTKFEVRTPTAVASARGTVIFFDVGGAERQKYSRIICLEGKVEVQSIVPGVTGTVLLTPGNMVVVKSGEAPPPPAPAPQTDMDNARKSTSSLSTEESTGTSVVSAPQIIKPPEPLNVQQGKRTPANIIIDVKPK